jgi:hypothetical protein
MLEAGTPATLLQSQWEKSATVRCRPRRLLEQFNTDTGFYYPVSRQPLAIHPEVVQMGDEAKRYILIQSLYKYCHDIVYIETEVVNRVTLHIVNNNLPVVFDASCRRDALTIIVDESYHAYVAMDALLQIQAHTHVEPLDLGGAVSLSVAIENFQCELAATYHKALEVLCVCIAENTLTKEIVNMMDSKETHRFFQHVLRDHLTDEARHSAFFTSILKQLWQNLSPDYQYELGTRLPTFISQYLDGSLQKAFDAKILDALKVPGAKIERILQDTHADATLGRHHPMLKSILALLQKGGVFEHEATKQAFTRCRWI